MSCKLYLPYLYPLKQLLLESEAQYGRLRGTGIDHSIRF